MKDQTEPEPFTESSYWKPESSSITENLRLAYYSKEPYTAKGVIASKLYEQIKNTIESMKTQIKKVERLFFQKSMSRALFKEHLNEISRKIIEQGMEWWTDNKKRTRNDH